MVNRKPFVVIAVGLSLLTLNFVFGEPLYFFLVRDSRNYFNLLNPQDEKYIIEKARIDANIDYAHFLSQKSFQRNSFDFSIGALSFEPYYSKLIVHSVFLLNRNQILVSLTNVAYEATFKDNNGPIFRLSDAWVHIFTNRELKVSIFDKYRVGVDCEIVSTNNISYRKSITFNISVYDRNGFPWCLFRDR